MNRSIWSDHELSTEQQVDSLKWSNELNHRIWGLIWELRRNENDKIGQEFFDHVMFYRKQSKEFERELAGILDMTFKNTEK